MKGKNILIGFLVIGGVYWLWNKYAKKPIVPNSNETNNVSKPQREIAPKPQTSSPNVQPSSATTNEATNTSIKSSFSYATGGGRRRRRDDSSGICKCGRGVVGYCGNTSCAECCANYEFSGSMKNNFMDFDGELELHKND